MKKSDHVLPWLSLLSIKLTLVCFSLLMLVISSFDYGTHVIIFPTYSLHGILFPSIFNSVSALNLLIAFSSTAVALFSFAFGSFRVQL